MATEPMTDARLAEIRRGLECGCYDQKWVGELMAEIDRLRPYYDAEIREQSMREQMEADCKAICEDCDLGEPVVGAEGEYGHASTGDPCDAHAIRAAWAKAHPEEAKGNAGEFARS